MFWNWLWLLAYVTGRIDQELLLRNEYLLAENKVLRSKLPKRIAFTDKERRTLGEIAHRLGKAALAQIAQAGLSVHGVQFLTLCRKNEAALSAEVLFLRKQLAYYQERKIPARRFDNLCVAKSQSRPD